MEKKQTMEQILQQKKIDLELDRAFETCNCASACDCTGTVVSAPVTEEQQKSYKNVYHYQPIPVKEK